MWGRIAALALFPAVSLVVGFSATAQELVYEPVNPSFGGDSFNSSHLLGIANAQNDYRDPDQRSSTNSQADQFIRQLQSRLLSSLAGEVNEAIFGENPQDEGTITFGDQVIEFFRGLESVHLTITDLATGSVTEIEIPLLYAGGESAASSAALGAVMSGQAGGLTSDQSGDVIGSSLSGDLSGDLSASGGIY